MPKIQQFYYQQYIDDRALGSRLFLRAAARRWLLAESGNAGDSASAYAFHAPALWGSRDFPEVRS